MNIKQLRENYSLAQRLAKKRLEIEVKYKVVLIKKEKEKEK